MKETFVIPQGHGVSIPDTPFLQKILGSDTDGRFFLMEATMSPRELVIPHTHTREDEFTFVHRGEIGARVGEQEVTVTAGSFLFKPRGIPHAMWNRLSLRFGEQCPLVTQTVKGVKHRRSCSFKGAKRKPTTRHGVL